eukprot:Em0013g1127a
MTCRSLRWLTEVLTALIFSTSVQPSSSSCPLLLISYGTSIVPQIGETVLVYCNFTGDSAGEVGWTKYPSLSIGPGQSVNPCNCVSQSSGHSSSLFVNVTSDAEYGTYTCTVQVGFGSVCSSFINIEKPVPPVLTAVGNTSQTVAQGSTVTFSVSLTNPGLPLANMVWSKDGVPLSNTSNMVVTSTTLQLSNIQAGDRGQYVAMATNQAGSISASFSLFVQFISRDNLQGSFGDRHLHCTELSWHSNFTT